MKKVAIMALLISLFTVLLATPKLTINQIQYTNNSAGGTYPSLYHNQVVSTQGTVTAINFEGNSFFIADAAGAWNGIQVNSNSKPTIGDVVLLTATVSEIFGCTVLTNVSSYQVIGKQTLPMPEYVSCFELSHNGEKYEGCYVAVKNVHLISNQANTKTISDDMDNAVIGFGFGAESNSSSWSTIRGIVSYNLGQYILNPRTINDFETFTNTNNTASWGRIKSLYR